MLRFFTAVKNDNFQLKNCDTFLILLKYIDRGYTLEPPQWAVLTSNHDLCFSAKKKNDNNVYPCKPQFYYTGVRGSSLHGLVA